MDCNPWIIIITKTKMQIKTNVKWKARGKKQQMTCALGHWLERSSEIPSSNTKHKLVAIVDANTQMTKDDYYFKF